MALVSAFSTLVALPCDDLDVSTYRETLMDLKLDEVRRLKTCMNLKII